jgi:low affinity Fe/Cu permease
MGAVTTLVHAGKGASGVNSTEPAKNSAESPKKWNDRFRWFSGATSSAMGRPWAFLTAIGLIVVWGLSGPLFHFSDTWQLVINTSTTIITFLMVFLIQNTQNRDAKAIHLKLDELIHAIDGARNKLVNLENLSDDELEKLESEFARLGKRYHRMAESQEKLEAAKSVKT